LNLLLFCSIYAQDLHEFSLHGGFGLSTLRYNPMLGEQSNGFDKQFGFGYAFFVSPRFGFGTGLELAFYSAELKLKNYKMEYEAKDYDKDTVDFMFRSIWSNYTEEQNAVMLQIPIMLQFQTNLGYYVMAGVKAAIPISGSSSGIGDLMNSGSYEKEPCEFYINDCIENDKAQEGENQWAWKGFGKFRKKTENQEKFKTSFLASMEMGMKWRFEDGLSLYTSVYFDYGLNNILEKKKLEELPQMVEYNSKDPRNFAVNGAFSSQQNKTQQAFVTKVMPMAIGIKIKLAFSQGLDYFAKKEEEERLTAAEIKRLEDEKQELEMNLERYAASEKMLIERETERLSAAEKLLEEARFAYQKAQNEQNITQATSADIMRLAAEKAQLEQEVAHLATNPPTEAEVNEVKTETPPPQLPVQEIEQNVTTNVATHASGEWIIQVAVVLQESRAESMVNSLKQKGFDAYYKKVSNPGKLTGTYYRVRVGYFGKMREAEDFAKTKLQSYNNWWLDKTENDTK
jgi:cell division septation protein DedD